MYELATEIDDLVESSIASNTWKVYKTAVDSFQNFRQLYDMSQSWPAPLNDILFYIAYLSHKNHSPSTVVTYISGLSHFHKLHNFPDNTQVFVVGKMIEGLKRKRFVKTLDNIITLHLYLNLWNRPLFPPRSV